MAVGIVALMAFNVVDTFFVAQLGTRELAAVSLTFPVVTLLFSLTLGLGTGVTAVVSQVLGEGDRGGFRRLTTDALLLGLVVVGTASVVGLLTIDPVFRALGADDALLPLVREYMEIWYLGMGFLVIPILGNAALRAAGDTRVPAMIMVGAALANAILDPLLIFGLGPIPAMGIRGAALATVIGRATTLVVALAVLGVREKAIVLGWPGVVPLLRSWRRIATVAAPAGATQALTPLAIAAVTAMVAGFGPAAVAAYGAGSRIEAVALIPSMALAAGLAPFVGQNEGARRPDRVAAAVRMSLRFAIGWGLFTFVAFLAVGGVVARAFVDAPEVAGHLATLLHVVPASHAAQGVFVVVVATFNASHRANRAAALGALRMFGLLVPGAFAGGAAFGLPGVFVGVAAAHLLGGAVAGAAVRMLPCWDAEARRDGDDPGAPAAGSVLAEARR